jgi:hypothetical protein
MACPFSVCFTDAASATTETEQLFSKENEVETVCVFASYFWKQPDLQLGYDATVWQSL